VGGYLIRKTKVLLLGGWQDSALTILKHFKNNSQYQFYVGDRWEYSVSRFSRYCNGFILLPNFAEDEKAYLKELIKSYKDNKIDVLLPIPQDEMVFVSRNKERLLKEGLKFLVPDYDLLEIAIDKYKLGEHLLKHSIPYPQTYCLANYTGQEILEKEGRLEEPFGKKLSGMARIFEIRVKHEGQWRVLYAYLYKDSIVVLAAFAKKTQKTPSAELRKAKKRLLDY